MRFIAELKDEELLPRVYDLSEDISKFLKSTNVLDIRKRVAPEGVTKDEQGRENVKEMLRVICKEYPKETADILHKLWVLDEGETEADVPIFVVSLAKLMNERWLIDFFISVANLTL